MDEEVIKDRVVGFGVFDVGDWVSGMQKRGVGKEKAVVKLVESWEQGVHAGELHI